MSRAKINVAGSPTLNVGADLFSIGDLALVPQITQAVRFGFNDAVGVTRETLWVNGGIYVYPPKTGEEIFIASTSAQDAQGGTGLWAYRIEGLDADGVEATLDVVLEGQTPVSIGTWSRIIRAHGILANTENGSQQGIVYVGKGVFTAGVPTTVYAHCKAATAGSQVGVYTIPLDKVGFLRSWGASSSGNGSSMRSVTVELMLRHDMGTHPVFGPTNFYTVAKVVLVGSSYRKEYANPRYLEPGMDIEIRATASAATDCSGDFEITLIEKDYYENYLKYNGGQNG